MKINMADDSGPFHDSSPTNDTENEEKEEEKMNALMDRLRSRVGHIRSWSDTAKAFKMSMAQDKRHPTEMFEKTLLQKHLETLQAAFRVMSLSLMLERLEMLSRQVSLKFHVGSSGTNVFLSSETFYVEIQLDSSGSVRDVQVAHNGEPQSCKDLAQVLEKGDIKEFQMHLEGLSSIYQINGDKKQRTKAFHALQALEDDLAKLGQLQSSISTTANYFHKSPLGILQSRSGGQPMKLTYFVHPYDLLDVKTKSSLPMTVAAVQERDAGHSVTVGIESSSTHKLQTMPLMTLKSQDGKSLPSFASLSHLNSSNIPATFMLRLHKPLPLSLSIIQEIHMVTGVEFVDTSKAQPIMSLILRQNTKNKVSQLHSGKGLHVRLPDQLHHYFINCVNGSGDLQGVMVSRIPFTHPTKVASVIKYLRQQVLFNTLIASCVRNSAKQGVNGCSPMTFEVTPLSLQHITVTFEHPIKECIASAEFDLTDITNVKCRICTTEDAIICSDEYACKVIQRCLSLPVTMRSILRKATGDLDLAMLTPSPEPVPLTPTLSQVGSERRLAFIDAHSGYRDSRFGSQGGALSSHELLHEVVESVKNNFVEPVQSSPGAMDTQTSPSTNKVDKISNNPLLASLLDQGGPSPDSEPTSMLSALLGDQPQMTSISKQRKVRKRRSMNDQKSPGSMGKSPKRKPSEEDLLSRDMSNSIDVDNCGHNALDIKASPKHGSRGISPSNSSLTGLLSDDHYNIPESHVTRLESSLDSIIKQGSKNLTGPHQSEMTEYEARRAKEDMVGKVEDARRISKASSLAELLDNGGRTETKDFGGGQTLPVTSGGGGGSGLSAAGGMTNMNQGTKTPMDTNVFDFKPDPDPPPYSSTKLISSSDRNKNSEKSYDSQEVSLVKLEKHTMDRIDGKSSSSESKSEEKVKEKVMKERTREKEEESKPPEREKIKLKVNTKDLTAKLSKESSSQSSSSPQTGLDKSSRDSSKSNKDSSKSYKEKVYDLTSDSEMPTPRPLLALDGTKPSSPSLKIKKIREDGREKKRSRYKHDSESSSSKRRREDSKKDKGAKKRRTVNESDYSDRTSSSVERYGPTTIKITTSGVKMQIQKGSSSSSSSGSSPINKPSTKSLSSSSSGLKSSSFKSDKLSSSFQSSSKSNKSSSIRNFNRSKSDPQGSALSYSKLDSKLTKTPTIKLKPVVMPNSGTTITVQSASSKSSNKLSSDLSKKPLQKARKSSLSAVIDKLKQQQTGSSISSAFKRDGQDLKFDRKDSNTPPPKKDPIADKNEMEAIRKAIIREGIKSSTPTKEIGAYKSSKSMRPSSLTIDSTKRPEPKTGTPTAPIPKLSQSFSNKSGTPINISTSKLGVSHNTPLNKSSSNTTGDSVKTSSNSKDAVLVMRSSSGGDGLSRTKLSNSTSTSGHGPPDSGGGGSNRPEKLESRKETSDSSSHVTNCSSTMLSSNSSAGSSGNAKEGSKNSSDRPQKAKVDDISERLQSRHFLDAVTNIGDSSSGATSGKDSSLERKQGSKGNTDSHRNDTLSQEPSGFVDKSRANGVTTKPTDSSRATDVNVNTAISKSESRTVRCDDNTNCKDIVTVPSSVSSSSTSKMSNDSSGVGGSQGMTVSNSGGGSSETSSSTTHNCRTNNGDASVPLFPSTPTRADSRHSNMSMTNSEDKENSVRHEDDMYRASMPKSNRSNADGEVRTDSRSKPVLSPRSDVSSPEDGLVIDCPGTPRPIRSPGSRTEKPVSNAKSPAPVISSSDTPINKSPASVILSKSPRSPSPRKPKVSPAVPMSPAAKSPMVQHNSPVAVQHHSPVEIDDDLMDAALML